MKPLFSKRAKALSFILALVMVLPLIPAGPVSALNGTASYKPAESNVAVKYWVTADASSNPGDAKLAIDGNLGTAWVAASPNASLTVDLSGTYDALRKTEVVFAGSDTAYKYKIEGSTDGEAWFMLADRTGNTRVAGGFTDLFSKPGIRYVKLTITGGAPVGVKEFRIINYLRPNMNNGSDVASLQSGTFYYNANNSPAQMLPDGSRAYRGGAGNTASMNTGNNFYGLTKDMGWDTIRLRIWNEPRSEGGWATPGVWDNGNGISATFPASNASGGSSPSTVRTHARYIVGAGQNLAIDFHYADSWADPQNQPKPYAWVNLPWDDPVTPLRIPDMTVAAATVPATYNPNNEAHHKTITRGLVSEVYKFTYDMIKSLIDQGTAPTIVAIGNEITHGMMWGKEYRLTNYYSPTETYNDHHDYYHRFIRDNTRSVLGAGTTYAQRYASSTIIDREDMPYGGGVEWMSYDNAKGDKSSPEYQSFLESVKRLSILIDAGQRAIYDLNEEYDLDMQTEVHFANNVFAEPRGGSKTMLDPEGAFEKFVTLVSEINNNMKDMSGFPDRIGISYYPDWHGTYAMLERNIIELQKVVPPSTQFNISECRPDYSGSVSNWMNDPNLVRGPWNPDAPTSFTRTIQYMGDYAVNLLKLINDVPGNAGMGIWPWDGQSVYGTGGTLRAGMLAFSQAYATGVVESGVYVTTAVGAAPALPATVKELTVANGTISDVAVAWNAVNPASYASAGTFEVVGTAASKGNMNEVRAYVTVAAETAGPPEFSEEDRNIDFNDDWKFYLASRSPSAGTGGFAAGGLADPSGAISTANCISTTYNDNNSNWRTLSVPHDFSIEGPKISGGSNSQGYYQGGLGWYRKHFTLPESARGKKIVIDFEGVYQHSNVYVNGALVGNYPSGYTGFAYDISDFNLKFGSEGENLITVKVQNLSPSGRWYTGSGITRPVHLLILNHTHVGRNGWVLTTPTLETTYNANKSAVLNVKTRALSGAAIAGATLAVRTVVKDGGTIVAEHTSAPVAHGPDVTLTDAVTVPNVKLWGFDDPHRYDITTELILNGEVTDAVSCKFGFRYFKIDPAQGFFLNGEYAKIQGVDLHHDAGAVGAASYTDAYRREMSILKSMGVNSYRTSHCPPSKQIIDVCSELGIVVMEEAYDGWGAAKSTNDFGLFFLTAVPSTFRGLGIDRYTNMLWSDWVIKEMVYRDINEPCVTMWSIGNEMRGVGTRPSWYNWNDYWRTDLDTWTKPGLAATTFSLFTESLRLRNDIYDIDPTRYIAVGHDGLRSPPTLNGDPWGYICQSLDGVGLNYNTAPSVDTLITRFANTGRRGTFFFESESSSQTGARGKYSTPQSFQTAPDQTPGNRGSSSFDNNFASWTMPNEYGLKKDRDRKAFLGQYIWSGFDYIGEPTPYGIYPVGGSSFGTIDLAGFPKDSYYLFRSQWTDVETDPIAHIVPMNWNDWQVGENVQVWVNTNAYQVDLYLNGELVGNRKFDIKYTNYGMKYYETTEQTNERGGNGYFTGYTVNAANPNGYNSPNTGATYGKLHLTWDVPYAPGELKAVAKDEAGNVVAEDVIRTAGPAYTITMKPDKQYLQPDGSSLLYVECDVVDAAGNRVPNAKNLIKFDIVGNGRIFGVDNGAPESSELHKWGGTATTGAEKSAHSERTAWMGKVLCIVKSEKGTGDIALTASGDNLLSTTLTVATEPGKAPAITHPDATAVQSVDVRTISVALGESTVLPRNVKVTYASGAALQKKVTWDPIAPTQFNAVGAFTVLGTFEDASITQRASINVNVMPDSAFSARTNIALNSTAGNQDYIFSSAQIAANAPLATASFTSGVNYPNYMLTSGTTNSWNNQDSSSVTVVLAARNYARANDTVEVYWPAERTFDQVSLYFNISTTSPGYSIPNTLKVQYWDGLGWADAANQVVTKATATNTETRITFGRVTSSRVRVFMTSSNPLVTTTTNGRMMIYQFQVYGRPIASSATFNVSYNANGGTGATVTASWPSGSVIKLAEGDMFGAPEGLAFKGWNTAADGSGASLKAGDEFTVLANAALYAVWGEKDIEIFDVSTRNIDFNDNWKFMLATRTPSVGGGSGAAGFRDYGLADVAGLATADVIKADFDDSGWRTVNVPHDYAIEGQKVSSSTNPQGYMQAGLGWYRKSFSLPEEMRESKKISIDFDGVYQNPVVYLNGQLVGNYPSGYSSFAFDITDKLKFGDEGENVLVVKVQNISSSGRWYTGSGIIRPVTLVVTSLTRIQRNGLTLSSPSLETTYKGDGSAVLNVEAKVYSDDSNGVVELRTIVKSGNDVVAIHTSDPQDCNPSSLTTLTDSITVPDVRLWSIDDPFRYEVVTEILFTLNGGEGTVVSDGAVTKYGFRWFKCDPAAGFLLNGVYTKLQGVDLHHDQGALGAAANYDALKRELSILRDMGVNSYRTSHCPPSKIVIDLCSELGIVVMEEAYDSWGATKQTYDFGVFFLQPIPANYNGQLNSPLPANATWSDWIIKEMVLRDINEPCIIMWSIGNEISSVGTRPAWYNWNDYRRTGLDDYAFPTGTSAYTATTFNLHTETMRLRNAILDIDDTRPIVCGTNQEHSTNLSQTSTWGLINNALDGIGLNYNTAEQCAYLMGAFPNTFFFESESSSQTGARGVYFTPSLPNTPPNQTPGNRGVSSYDNNFASWTISNEYGLKKDRDYKNYLGQYIWSGFDYIGEPTPFNIFPVGISFFGTIDTAGFPKDSFYLFQSQWTKKPMAHIVPMNWNDYRPGEIVEVWVNTNAVKAELFLNGVSLGVKSFDEKTTTYGLKYYETSEATNDNKNNTTGTNRGGYVSPNGEYGRLRLTWYVPYAPGELKVVAMDENNVQVAADSVKTASQAYTISMKPDKEFVLPDGRSLVYVECDIVDESGVMLPSAGNLVKFDIVGDGMIYGVDNGKQESSELYKWGNLDKNSHSERSAYNGKVLVIVVGENKGAGSFTLTASSENLVPTVLTMASRRGVAPMVAHPALGTVASVQSKTISLGAFTPTVLPRDVKVTYSSGITLIKKVTWDAAPFAKHAAGATYTVSGKFDDASITTPASLTVNVVAPARANLALNTSAGAQDVVSATGPLATASFTGTTNYPNYMLNGNTTNFWFNWATQGASTLHPAINESRPYDYVEVYWPSEVTLNQISLYLNLNTNCSMPGTFQVWYWDGIEWVNAPAQAVSKAAATAAETKILFGAVTTSRVRVGMENATPLNATTGRIQITRLEAYLNSDTLILESSAAEGTATATLSNGTANTVTGHLILAVYDSSSRLIWMQMKDMSAAPGSVEKLSVAYPENDYKGYTLKAFAWDDDFVPLLAGQSLILPEPVRISSIDSVSVSTPAGTAPSLPATVTARYNNGTSAIAAVVWDVINPSQYEAVGSFTVEGAVEGTAIKAVATVTVTSAVPAGNLLLLGNPRNSYFDSTTGTSNYNGTNWSVPSSWGSPGTNTSESRSAGISGHSQMALKYWISAAPASTALRAYLTVTPAVLGLTSIPAGQYQVSCFARSGSTTSGQYFQIFATAGSTTQTLNIANTNTWTSRQVTINVPAGATSFEIGIQVTSTNIGTGAWGQFDDFSVVYVG